MSVETWANLTPLKREPKPEVSREEWLRRERVAVGKICRCGSCYCCEEVKRERTRV